MLLARRLGLRKARRSYCAWVHYWVWWDASCPEEIGYGGSAKDVRIVCSDEKQKSMLIQHGYIDVVVGGIPFAYVPQIYAERQKRSLLVFLPHSLDYYNISLSSKKYLDYLLTLKSDFSRIDVCIYSHDYDEGTQKRECEERGLNTIRGACPDDADALIKVRALMECFEYVTSPYISAHILYAAFCGCKVSITRPIFYYGKEYYNNDPYMQRYPFLMRLFDTVNSEEYIKDRFPWLIVDHPIEATEHISWATEKIGEKFVLNDHALRLALGWDAFGRIRGPLMGLKRRLLRLILK